MRCGACERPREALAHYDAALALKPDYAEAHNNRGNALLDLNRTARRVAEFRPRVGAQSRLSRRAGQPRQCVARSQPRRRGASELSSAPSRSTRNWPRRIGTRRLLQLSRGDFEAGWRGYEWRWRRAGAAPRDFAQPQWRGEDLDGKTILLHAEQGFGDTIQFARYIPMVVAKSGKIILEVPDTLMPLLTDIEGVSRDAEPWHGAAAVRPALSADEPAARLRHYAGNHPGRSTLSACADRAHRGLARAPAANRQAARRPRLVRASRRTTTTTIAAFALARLAPLLDAPGVAFVSLQRDIRDGDRRGAGSIPCPVATRRTWPTSPTPRRSSHSSIW